MKFVNSRTPTIKNIKKAAARIKKAVKSKERVILYGDADMDGVSSVIILKEALCNLGVSSDRIQVYFPDRETEGYGINEKALGYLKKQAPALFIALDCGIGNFHEIKLAKKMGFEVMIVDHHQTLGKLPEASIIVNPQQKGDKYSFKEFAAAGVVFRLVEVLLGKKICQALRNNFLELTALATLADMMPHKADNLEFLNAGLPALQSTFRPGLKVFHLLGDYNDPQMLARKIISACHAGENKNHFNEAYLLLSSCSEEEAEVLARDLIEKSYIRQERIKVIAEEAEERILKKMQEPIIFEGDKDWPILMAGPAASKICHVYKKPVFLYSQNRTTSQGAVRTPVGIDGVRAMRQCADLLETFGGHPQAAGFRLKNKNLKNFKERLTEYFNSI